MIVIRPLEGRDSEAYKRLRLKALRDCGDLLQGDIREEKNRTIQQWKDAAIETTERVIFGAFNDDELIGILGARKWNNDPTGSTARFHGLYISPPYRGKSIGEELYANLYSWCANNNYKEVVFTVREDNNNSIRLSIKSGATPDETEPMRFASGRVSTVRWFRKALLIIRP